MSDAPTTTMRPTPLRMNRRGQPGRTGHEFDPAVRHRQRQWAKAGAMAVAIVMVAFAANMLMQPPADQRPRLVPIDGPTVLLRPAVPSN